MGEQDGFDLAVIDPLAPFCRGENLSRSMFDLLLPLSELLRRDMAVLVMHHPAKGERPIGQAARGSGALQGHVDISIEMRHPAGDPMTRRRRILALSRFSQTPRSLMLELNQQATDYLLVPEDHVDPFLWRNWDRIRMVLDDAPKKLTRQEILENWSPDFPTPSLTALVQLWL